MTTLTNGYPIRIRTLGCLSLEVDGAPLRFGRTSPRKPLALLQALLCARGQPVSTVVICESLWPDADPHDAYRALVTTVYRLRRWLQHRDAIHFDHAGIALDESSVWVDAWAFERNVAAVESLPTMVAALELYRGAFLGDEQQAFVLEARDRLQRKFVRGVRSAGHQYEIAGKLHAAIGLYERALEVVAVSEDIHRLLMQCLIQLGQTSAAAQIFQRCRMLLASRLGVSPSAPTVLAYRSIEAAARDQRVTSAA
jgi:DNA-binding SARP family transcriptional activator